MTAAVRSAPLTVEGLEANQATDPLGIDDPRPHLSWRLRSQRRGTRQVGYRLTVAVVPPAGGDGFETWDTGWVESARQLGVEYDGPPLVSHTRYRWSVRVRADDGLEAVSDPAWFETAYLDPSECRAQWIACVTMTPTVPSPLFRTEVTVPEQVVRARAHVSGLGYYELFVNGERVGDSVLDPAWTDYRSRVLYATYDVLEHLAPGRNAIGVALGNGWFSSTPDAVPSQLQPQLLLELRLDLADGSTTTLHSRQGAGWQTTIDGPVREHSIYGGEHLDARREMPEWAEAGYDTEASPARWRPAIAVEPPGGALQAQAVEPIRVVRELPPVSIRRLGPTSQVVDFGQNFAGWVRLRLVGEPGTTVSVRHAELVHDDGTVNTVNLRTAKASDAYTLDGRERWFEPRFTYHGFRFAQVDDYAPDLGPQDVVGRVVRSSVETVGRFACSDPLVDRIHQNIVWTEGSNLHGLPTDCPQRDERLAWLNDMTVRAEEAVYNFDLARLYSKWLDDIVDTQGAVTGAIADTAPNVRYGHRPADPVSSSFLIVPALVHRHYGDARLIQRGYEKFGRWVDYLSALSTDNLIEQSEIGDWAPPVSQAVAGSAGSGAVSAATPGGLVSTSFFYLDLRLMAEFADMLERPDEARAYRERAEAVRAAINDRYLDEEAGRYGTGNQASNALALYLDLVPEQHRSAVLDSLISDIDAHDHHLTTGNLCTKYVMDVLGRAGRSDIAVRLLTQRTYPSWGYMVDQGATTIWERWEHVTGGVLAGMGSHNHPMYGAVGSWFYRFLAGINPSSTDPGYGHVEIEPLLAPGIDAVDCEITTVRGRVGSSWRRNAGGFDLDIEIPANVTACARLVADQPRHRLSEVREGEAVLWQRHGRGESIPGIKLLEASPDGFRVQLGSGSYRFRVVREAGNA